VLLLIVIGNIIQMVLYGAASDLMIAKRFFYSNAFQFSAKHCFIFLLCNKKDFPKTRILIQCLLLILPVFLFTGISKQII